MLPTFTNRFNNNDAVSWRDNIERNCSKKVKKDVSKKRRLRAGGNTCSIEKSREDKDLKIDYCSETCQCNNIYKTVFGPTVDETIIRLLELLQNLQVDDCNGEKSNKNLDDDRQTVNDSQFDLKEDSISESVMDYENTSELSATESSGELADNEQNNRCGCEPESLERTKFDKEETGNYDWELSAQDKLSEYDCEAIDPLWDNILEMEWEQTKSIISPVCSCRNAIIRY